MAGTNCRLQELLLVRRPVFPTNGLFGLTGGFLNSGSAQIDVTPQGNIRASYNIAANHQVTHHHNRHHQQVQQKRRYCCTKCPYSTDRRDLFTRHENIHRDEKPFRCYICNKMFNRADHVKKHFLRIHKGLDYDVKLTKRIKGVDYDVKEPVNDTVKTNTFISLKEEDQFGDGQPMFLQKGFCSLTSRLSNCSSLLLSTLNQKNFVEQLAEAQHNESLKPETQSTNSNSPDIFAHSIVSNHNSIDPDVNPVTEMNGSSEYECEHCGCAFLNFPSLHTHRYLLHRYVCENQNYLPYRCVLCGQRSITQRAMIQHMLRHSSSSSSSSSTSTSTSLTKLQAHKPNLKPPLKQIVEATAYARNRRKQLQPRKIVKQLHDLDYYEEPERSLFVNKTKFSCKICHKEFITYTQQVQHQQFSKH